MSQIHAPHQASTAGSAAFASFVHEPARFARSPSLQPQPASGELRFCQLHSPAEISRVMHLRRELRLPASGLSEPSFAALEKKETSWASSALSSGTGASSAPSASFP
jgi:hypothetical protein